MQLSPNEAIAGFTRQAVRDVFQEMLTLEVQEDEPKPLASEPAGQIVGSVGFIGQATGVIYLYTGAHLGRVVTSKMLALAEAEVDEDMVNDAFGELCNMVVGAVKSQICDRGWPCVLTIPSILRGNQLSVEAIADAAKTILGFRAGDHRLIVEILIKHAQANAQSV
jgi:chemotaxis protein CheX